MDTRANGMRIAPADELAGSPERIAGIAALEPRACGHRWVEISSDLSAGLQLLEIIVLELRLAGFAARQIGLVELAFTEALINAIRHGNQDDPRKSVLIEYRIQDEAFQLEIEDEGGGFDPVAVVDPTEPEHLARPGGRGLLLIRSLADRVEFNARGNRIRIQVSRLARRAA